MTERVVPCGVASASGKVRSATLAMTKKEAANSREGDHSARFPESWPLSGKRVCGPEGVQRNSGERVPLLPPKAPPEGRRVLSRFSGVSQYA